MAFDTRISTMSGPAAVTAVPPRPRAEAALPPNAVGRAGHQRADVRDRWVDELGLDRSDFGTRSVRRTKAALIYRRTKSLRAVQLLLGHSKLESMVRYLGVDVDDALEMSEQTEIRTRSEAGRPLGDLHRSISGGLSSCRGVLGSRRRWGGPNLRLTVRFPPSASHVLPARCCHRRQSGSGTLKLDGACSAARVQCSPVDG